MTTHTPFDGGFGNPISAIVSFFRPVGVSHRKNPRPTSMTQPHAKGYFSAEVVCWFKQGKWAERCEVYPKKHGFDVLAQHFCKPTADGPGLELRIEATYLTGPKTCQLKRVIVREARGREMCSFRGEQIGSAAQPFLIWLATQRPN